MTRSRVSEVAKLALFVVVWVCVTISAGFCFHIGWRLAE